MRYDPRQALEVARLYHVAKLSQREISARFRLSRPTISRILRQAEETGIVQVRIVDPFNHRAALEKRLAEEFGLREARIINTSGQSGNKARALLGEAGAEYLVKVLKPGDTLGVAWGRTTLEIARKMPHYHVDDMRVVSLIGCTYENTMDEGLFDVARLFGRKLGAELFLLYTPVIVSSAAAKRVYLSENHTRKTMEHIARSNITLNGIGDFSRDSMLYRFGYVSEGKRAELERKGAAGNFCSLYYDVDGNPVDRDLNARTIGISLDAMKTKERSIGVATGREKAAAILGALRGRFINILLTDEDAANLILEMNGRKPKTGPRGKAAAATAGG